MTKSEALQEAWKKRKDYKGYDRTKGSAFNSWRAIIYTAKGKDIGFPETWKDYNVFLKEVQGEWERGKIVVRLDTSKPHGPDNSRWAIKGAESLGKLTKLEYEGETKTLIEWCEQYNLNYNGVRQRYFKGKNYTSKEVLFGKPRVIRPKAERDHDYVTSRKLGAYKLSDKKKGLVCDISLSEFKEIILDGCIYCGYKGSIGLDRIDNAIGHTRENVVPCCYECNCARNNNFTHEEMLRIGKVIREIRKDRDEKDKEVGTVE